MACCVTSRTRMVAIYFVLAVVALWVGASPASAQNRLGGHFGAVFPLVTRVNGDTVNIVTKSHFSRPSAPGAEPPRNSFLPPASVMFLPTALFVRSLA